MESTYVLIILMAVVIGGLYMVYRKKKRDSEKK